jgi:uncharacterized membrane protein YdjX (TVP38/TMEM64 family)
MNVHPGSASPDEPGSASAQSRRWRVVRAGLFSLGLLALLWAWYHWDEAAFLAWKQEIGPVTFFAALAILPAIGVPTTPFFMLAGMTFGLTVGLLGTAASLAINMVLCFWIAHSGLRQWLGRLLARWGRELPQLEGRKALRFAVLVKLTPGVPAFVKQYALGLSGMQFGPYFLVSFFITLPYAAAFVVLGESIFIFDWQQGIGSVLALLGLAGVVAGARYWWLRRS